MSLAQRITPLIDAERANSNASKESTETWLMECCQTFDNALENLRSEERSNSAGAAENTEKLLRECCQSFDTALETLRGEVLESVNKERDYTKDDLMSLAERVNSFSHLLTKECNA